MECRCSVSFQFSLHVIYNRESLSDLIQGRTPTECTAKRGSQGGGNGCDRNARWHCHEAAGAVRRGCSPNDLHTVHSDSRRNCAVIVTVLKKAKEQPVCAEFETSAEYGVLQEQRDVQITSKRLQGMEHCRALRNAAYEASKWTVS